MFRQAPSFPYHDLGIVEDGSTASRAISKDAYVIWKGASYFASTDILQGATLEEDVNLTAIPDGVINGVVSALNNNFVLLWTNPHPDSGYGTDNIVVDLSAYRFVLIVTNDGTAIAQVGYRYVAVDSLATSRHREFWAFPTYIQVTAGSNTLHCIPVYVYGIK